MTTFSLAGGRWEFDSGTGAVTIDGKQVGTVRPLHSQVLAIMGGKVIATTHTIGQAQDAIVERWRSLPIATFDDDVPDHRTLRDAITDAIDSIAHDGEWR